MYSYWENIVNNHLWIEFYHIWKVILWPFPLFLPSLHPSQLPPSLFLSSWQGRTAYPWLALTHKPPTSISWLFEITNIHHHAWSFNIFLHVPSVSFTSWILTVQIISNLNMPFNSLSNFYLSPIFLFFKKCVSGIYHHMCICMWETEFKYQILYWFEWVCPPKT